jgi:RHS repeat-associated protein
MARYAYDPFGDQLTSVGPAAGLNRYRFSSKEWQPNAGLYYYGYRFCEPNLQRWINQDPIGEEGGINLYTILINNPINNIDLFGNDVMVVRESWSPFSHRKVIIFQPGAKICKNNKITITEFGAKDTPKNWWSLRWFLRKDRFSTQPCLAYEWSDSYIIERYLELTLMEDNQLIDKINSFDSGKPCTYFIIGKTCIDYADKVFHWAHEIASRRTFIKAR